MRVNVRGKNIEVTDALRGYVEKRLKKLEKYLNNYGDAQVTLTVERDSHRIEVTIPINGMILRGEESTGDMYASVDQVVEKLEKQVERFKGRITRRLRTAGAAGVGVENEEPLEVVRTKRFAIKPMEVEEAIMQMNLLGHSFFVFANAETEQVNVVYKRKDGNYGLIEPEP
ncbi:MAG: ribosome-associated translation inhibitor RaiA [Thermoanaerobacterales bacterium]|nr:ribosome-associated translation inhibitor RaiA [Bacillota bacterium]MDI6907417.1 ribosome-associated translation inhibitor RaiA [Thermoanaerobacterales bacterium]